MPNRGEWVVGCLQGAWPRLLGDRLAAVCRPASFDGSTLVIEAIDDQWRETVKGIGPTLLEKLRAATAGEVSRISIASCHSPLAGEH